VAHQVLQEHQVQLVLVVLLKQQEQAEHQELQVLQVRPEMMVIVAQVQPQAQVEHQVLQVQVV